MIKKIYGKPHEGMQFEVLTVDQRKAILKQRLKRMFLFFFGSATFWLIVGYALGSAYTVYILTDAISQIDKLLVCK